MIQTSIYDTEHNALCNYFSFLSCFSSSLYAAFDWKDEESDWYSELLPNHRRSEWLLSTSQRYTLHLLSSELEDESLCDDPVFVFFEFFSSSCFVLCLFIFFLLSRCKGIWRNLTNNHIMHYTPTNCDHCNHTADLDHYIYGCPKTEPYRQYFREKFKEVTNIKCTLHAKPASAFDFRTQSFFIHHSGYILPDTEQVNKSLFPRINKKWTEIQLLLTLLVGKAHKEYYKDNRKTKRKRRNQSQRD